MLSDITKSQLLCCFLLLVLQAYVLSFAFGSVLLFFWFDHLFIRSFLHLCVSPAPVAWLHLGTSALWHLQWMIRHNGEHSLALGFKALHNRSVCLALDPTSTTVRQCPTYAQKCKRRILCRDIFRFYTACYAWIHISYMT